MKQLATFLSVLAMVAVAPLARADFQISVNGAAPCAGGGGSPTGPFGEGGTCADFQTANGVNVIGLGTNGAQTTPNSEQFTSTTKLKNTTGSVQTITIDAATNDFTSPNAPPTITDAFTFSLSGANGVTSATFHACVDAANGLTAPTGTCGMTGPISTTGTLSSASGTGQIIIPSLGPSAFGLNEEIVLTLAAGTSVTVQGTQTLTNVPEPAAILLFGTMLLGVTSIVRRKAAKRA